MILLHQADQVGAAGENVRFAPFRAEQRRRLPAPLSGLAYAKACIYAFLLSSAASTRSGVSGIRGTRTPMAFATALPIAVSGLTAGGSPKPDHAALVVLLGDIQMHDNLADVADAGQLVKLHVRIQHAAGLLVHDALFHRARCRCP